MSSNKFHRCVVIAVSSLVHYNIIIMSLLSFTTHVATTKPPVFRRNKNNQLCRVKSREEKRLIKLAKEAKILAKIAVKLKDVVIANEVTEEDNSLIQDVDEIQAEFDDIEGISVAAFNNVMHFRQHEVCFPDILVTYRNTQDKHNKREAYLLLRMEGV